MNLLKEYTKLWIKISELYASGKGMDDEEYDRLVHASWQLELSEEERTAFVLWHEVASRE